MRTSDYLGEALDALEDAIHALRMLDCRIGLTTKQELLYISLEAEREGLQAMYTETSKEEL